MGFLPRNELPTSQKTLIENIVEGFTKVLLAEALV
jgi:hypothetical protein